MEVLDIQQALFDHFNKMVEKFDQLFVVQVNKDDVWNIFLDSFPEGENTIYKERRKWDCTCCHHFFNVMSKVVAVDDEYKMISIFDFDCGNEKWQPIFDNLARYIHECGNIVDVFVHDEEIVGTPVSRFEYTDNSGNSPKKKVGEFHHFHISLPKKYNIRGGSYRGYTIESYRSDVRSRKQVFKRGLEELTIDAMSDTLDMINGNNLYKGEEWKDQLYKFKELKEEFESIEDDLKDNYTWKKVGLVGPSLAKIRNTSIGTLLVDLSEGVVLEEAVKKYEKVVAPENYRRSKPIFTKKMLEDAKEKIIELGLENSLGRRFAILDDINVRDILYANRDSAKKMKGGSVLDEVFESMEHETSSVKPKEFRNVPEVSIDEFLSDILPKAIGLEAYLENRHGVNMVSLIAPTNADAPSITKWENNFTWAYAGNVTDSLMKERVKASGGRVEGDLRFSIQWNDDPSHYNSNDFDAHCVELPALGHKFERAGRYEIFFGNKQKPSPNGGVLDVDIIEPSRGQVAVENIVYETRDRMHDGQYIFYVNNYTNRGGTDGFSAEIEFDGQIFSYECRRPVSGHENIKVATVTLKDGEFTIEHHLQADISSKPIWNISTNNFIPVSTVMYSPNYWNQQEGIGHRHYFFMLKDCKNPTNPNGFYNEFLKDDLREHRKVFEALGAKMMVPPSDDQLSGLGFSSTRRNDLIVKVEMPPKYNEAPKVVRIKF